MNRDHVHVDAGELHEVLRELAGEPAVPRQLPAVPDWVADPAKWLTLSRPQRRALIRHHAKQVRRG